MLVVGGTYSEACETPARDMLAGSGLRAAAVLRNVNSSVRLVSARADEEDDTVQATAGALNIEVTWLDRSAPVGFGYFTPLSAPTIDGRSSTLVDDHREAEFDDDVALVFGMVEERPNVRAKVLVVDPQQPRELSAIDTEGLSWERLAVVLNAAETMSVGADRTVESSAHRVLQNTGAEVVVTKRGPRGALVTTAREQVTVGAIETVSVWPIGSGDVFAAAFAHLWGDGADPVDAARGASRAASRWCATGSFDIAPESFEVSERGEVPVNEALVYLAGPFFTLAERWLIDLCYATLRPYLFSPIHEVGLAGVEKPAREIADEDLAGLEVCHAVLALLDGSDPGTAFEVGYATKLGLPVVGYGENIARSGVTMMAGSGTAITNDLSTAVYRAVWAAMRRAASAGA